MAFKRVPPTDLQQSGTIRFFRACSVFVFVDWTINYSEPLEGGMEIENLPPQSIHKVTRSNLPWNFHIRRQNAGYEKGRHDTISRYDPPGKRCLRSRTAQVLKPPL